jgi:hypothetical protein
VIADRVENGEALPREVARLVCAKEADLGVLDLKERVAELIDMIRAANI